VSLVQRRRERRHGCHRRSRLRFERAIEIKNGRDRAIHHPPVVDDSRARQSQSIGRVRRINLHPSQIGATGLIRWVRASSIAAIIFSAHSFVFLFSSLPPSRCDRIHCSVVAPFNPGTPRLTPRRARLSPSPRRDAHDRPRDESLRALHRRVFPRPRRVRVRFPQRHVQPEEGVVSTTTRLLVLWNGDVVRRSRRPGPGWNVHLHWVV